MPSLRYLIGMTRGTSLKINFPLRESEYARQILGSLEIGPRGFDVRADEHVRRHDRGLDGGGFYQQYWRRERGGNENVLNHLLAVFFRGRAKTPMQLITEIDEICHQHQGNVFPKIILLTPQKVINIGWEALAHFDIASPDFYFSWSLQRERKKFNTKKGLRKDLCYWKSFWLEITGAQKIVMGHIPMAFVHRKHEKER